MDVDSIDRFRPIAMCNFKFNFFSKTLVDSLAFIMALIVSKEKKGFIRGRNVIDFVCLESETFNTYARQEVLWWQLASKT